MVADAHLCHYFRTVNGNRKFIEELTKWTFQEKSALDVVAVQHHKVGEEEAPAHYRIKDNMVRSCYVQMGDILGSGLQMIKTINSCSVNVFRRTRSRWPSTARASGTLSLPTMFSWS